MEATLQLAARWLAEGKWRKAERACQEILERDDVPDAAHLLGQIYVSSEQPKRALEWLQKALAWNPQNARAHFACAAILHAEGNSGAAAASWIAGLEIDHTFFSAHIGLADALLDLRLYEAAMIAAKHALLVDSESADAYARLARAADLGGNRIEAIAALEQTVTLRPNSAVELSRLAALYNAEGRVEQARELLERAVRLQPRNAGLRFEYAQLLAKLGARQTALEQLREAVRLQPRFPEALSNMGMLLRADQRLSEAEAAYKKACAQNPGFAAAWNNLGNLYLELARLNDAERCYSKAIVVNPDYAEAHTSRAMLRLLNGRFEEGWLEYEWRWQRAGQQPAAFPQPQWDGSDLSGRTILLHAEQGAGDTIQFIRYARDLKNRSARVVVQCPASLRTLLESVPGVDSVFCGNESIDIFDVHAPLLSLPRLCGTDFETIPKDVPYLRVPAGTIVPDVLLRTDALGVGLVWSGNPNHHNDRNRSIPPVLFRELLGVDGVRFFSLQVGGERLEEMANFAPPIDLGPFLTSYAVTAACLEHLDLLITVDTSVAHLAGALGRPVWMAIPTCNDWRWLLNRSDSPWYPTMRIFRQRTLGDWKGVIQEIKKECLAWAKSNRHLSVGRHSRHSGSENEPI